MRFLVSLVSCLCGLVSIQGKTPAFPIIDTHVHQAKLGKFNYTFPATFPSLNKSWNMAEFTSATSGSSLQGVVLMQLEKRDNTFDSSLAEAIYYQKIADDCEALPANCTKVLGIVAGAPLEAGADEVRKYLQSVTQSAPLVKGIRESLWKHDTSFFKNQSFIYGIKVLAEFNLVFDLLIHKEQLQAAKTLAEAIPEVKFNLNHLAYPNISSPNSSDFDTWASDIEAFASLNNTFCKMSGLPQCAGKDRAWGPTQFTPYIAQIIKVFGADRINYAGNWFVLDQFGDYPTMIGAVTNALAGLKVNQTDLEKIFASTASVLYNLNTTT